MLLVAGTIAAVIGVVIGSSMASSPQRWRERAIRRSPYRVRPEAFSSIDARYRTTGIVMILMGVLLFVISLLVSALKT